MYALAESERGGSTCLPMPELLAACERLTGDLVGERIVDSLVDDRRAVREDDWVYRTATAELEAELADPGVDAARRAAVQAAVGHP